MKQTTDFEQEKWRSDLELRQRELAIKEREQANRDTEIELKRKEQASANWRSPLVVALLAAAVAAAGNAVIATVNGSQQRNLEDRKHAAELVLENTKAESSRILEMIKVGDDPDKAARNMDFLLRSGLISDPSRVSKLSDFLKNRKPGIGPSLPSNTPRFGFEPTADLSETLRASLQNRLDDYAAYLEQIGLPTPNNKVTIVVTRLGTLNALYSSAENKISIDTSLASDPQIALSVYNYHVLGGRSNLPSGGPQDAHYLAIQVGLADYLACSFLDNPKVGEASAKDNKPIRRLDNERKFSELLALLSAPGTPQEVMRRQMWYEASEIWSGAFWEMRTKLRRETMDPIISKAWMTAQWPNDDLQRGPSFVKALLSAANTTPMADPNLLKSVLQIREFPLPR